MLIELTSTPSLKEQMQELQRSVPKKRPKSLISLLTLKIEGEKNNEPDSSNAVITPQNIKEWIAQGIEEHQAAMRPPVLGYKNPYPSHYDSMTLLEGYEK